MKLFPRTLVLIAALAASILTARAQPTDKQRAELEESMQLSMAGPGHEPLKQLEGTWEQSFNFIVAPGAQPISGTGLMENVMIMGNRFLQTVGQVTAMGTKVGSLQVLGFDNRKQKYFLFSIDEMGTYAMTAEGDYNAKTRTFTLRGSDSEGGKVTEFMMVFQVVGPNEYNSSLSFLMPDGTMFTSVRTNNKRKS